jgi:hypothetical protein
MADETEATETPEAPEETAKERAQHYFRVGQYSLSIHDSVEIDVPSIQSLLEGWASEHELMIHTRVGDSVTGFQVLSPDAYAAKVEPANGITLKREEAKSIKGALELAMERGISRDDFMAALKLALDNGTILPQNVAPKDQRQV